MSENSGSTPSKSPVWVIRLWGRTQERSANWITGLHSLSGRGLNPRQTVDSTFWVVYVENVALGDDPS